MRLDDAQIIPRPGGIRRHLGQFDNRLLAPGQVVHLHVGRRPSDVGLLLKGHKLLEHLFGGVGLVGRNGALNLPEGLLKHVAGFAVGRATMLDPLIDLFHCGVQLVARSRDITAPRPSGFGSPTYRS